jgi:AcrR family transcriptional regulator
MEQQNVDTVNIRMKNGPVAKKKQYHHPDLRQALLDEAVRLIDDEGLRGFSLRKLAVRTGVSHAAPYRHFANKDEILVILMLEGHKRLRQALLAARELAKGSAVDHCLAMSKAYLTFAQQNPEYLRVMFSREAMAAAAGLADKEEAHQEDYDSFGVLEAMIRDCQKEGALPRNADVGALGLLVWAEVHGLALLCNEGMIARMSEIRGGSEEQTLEVIFGIMRSRFKR